MTNPSGPLSVKEADTGLDRVIPKTQIGNEPSVGFFVSLEIQNCCQTHWMTTCGGGNQQRPEWALNTHKTTSEWVLVGITCKVRVYAGVKTTIKRYGGLEAPIRAARRRNNAGATGFDHPARITLPNNKL